MNQTSWVLTLLFLLGMASSLHEQVGLNTLTSQQKDHLSLLLSSLSQENINFTFDSNTTKFTLYYSLTDFKYYLIPIQTTYVVPDAALVDETFQFDDKNTDFKMILSESKTFVSIPLGTITDSSLEYVKMEITVKKNNCGYLYLRWDNGSLIPEMVQKADAGNNISVYGFSIKRQDGFKGLPTKINFETGVTQVRTIKEKTKKFLIMCPYFLDDSVDVEFDLKLITGPIATNEEPTTPTPTPVVIPDSPKDNLESINSDSSITEDEKEQKQSDIIETYIEEVIAVDDLVIKIQEDKSNSTEGNEDIQVDKTDNVFQTQKVEINGTISKPFYKIDFVQLL